MYDTLVTYNLDSGGAKAKEKSHQGRGTREITKSKVRDNPVGNGEKFVSHKAWRAISPSNLRQQYC